MQLSIHVDGASRGNPGPAAAGIVIRRLGSDDLMLEAGYHLGRMTNNCAEYEALIRALQITGDSEAGQVHIFSDSELMVRQITGEYRVKSPVLKPLYEQVQHLLLKLDHWQVQHIDREQNVRADELANLALDAGCDEVVLDKMDAAAGGAGQGLEPAGSNASTSVGQVRWTTNLAEGKANATSCPLGCPNDTPFAFGPATPSGFCIHATKAVFAATPIDAPVKFGNLRRIETTCEHCGLLVRIEPNA